MTERASPTSHRLLLLRHAKSSWDDAARPDHDRPLTKRGRRAADVMGTHLRTRGLVPDLVLCSSSRRTRETLERLGLAGAEVAIEERLYAAGEDDLLGRLREVDEGVRSGLLIGHNPGVQDLATELAGPARMGDAARIREKFPTGALALFAVDGAWRDLDRATARLESFTAPRDLG